MKMIDHLKNDHQKIGTVLNKLDEVCSQLETGESVNLQLMERLVYFLRIYADLSHHQKEEQILFPELQQTGLTNKSRTLDLFFHEHDLGHIHLMRLIDSVFNSDGDIDYATFRVNGKAFSHMMKNHLSVENALLFQMAENYLTEEADKRMMVKLTDLLLSLEEKYSLSQFDDLDKFLGIK